MWRSSSVPITQKDLLSSRSGGSSNERSHGLGGAGVSPKLGESQLKGARISAPRFNQTYAEKTMQSSMISPDRELMLSRIRNYGWIEIQGAPYGNQLTPAGFQAMRSAI